MDVTCVSVSSIEAGPSITAVDDRCCFWRCRQISS